MYFYSIATKGFYNSEIHGKNIPPDSIEIGDDQYSELKDWVNDNREIVFDFDRKTLVLSPTVA